MMGDASNAFEGASLVVLWIKKARVFTRAYRYLFYNETISKSL